MGDGRSIVSCRWFLIETRQMVKTTLAKQTQEYGKTAWYLTSYLCKPELFLKSAFAMSKCLNILEPFSLFGIDP